MKKLAMLLLVGLTCLTMLTGCGKEENTEESIPVADVTESVADTVIETESAEETVPETADEKTLVVYFSCTGNTKDVAEKIAEITDADLYEIKAAQEYTSEDLNWHDSSTRATSEQNDPDARPEIGSEPLKLEGYTTVYIGYPIWWGEEPRIMDTFVESYDFTDITMIPFCTSASSGMGSSGKNLAENAGSGNWLEGSRFAPGTSSGDLESWIHSLK